MKKKIILLGAGGRDFHNFNVCFKGNPNYRVAAFTAAQIPYIENRTYPPVLSGPLYPRGIPIFPQKRLGHLIKKYGIDEVVFAYSDISHLNLMHLASQVLAAGADFRLIGPKETFLKSRVPVVSVCAIRTGCGKTKLTLEIAKTIRAKGKRAVILRHPMPYGNLAKQVCQRFQTPEDLDRHACTIEEREEYEPLLNEGFVVFAGVDYKKILAKAEKEADAIIWDGGNNDLPFLKPKIHIVVCDPHRPGHELLYYPGETNLRMADLVVINKVNTAKKQNVAAVLNNVKLLNPGAPVLFLESKISVDEPAEAVRNKTVLVVEDGPTVTHGEMAYGAGFLAAKELGAKRILKPRNWATGEIKKAYLRYPHLNYILPALGYGEKQLRSLEKTINAIPCEAVVSGTPINLKRIIKIRKPLIQVNYGCQNSGFRSALKRILRKERII